MNSVANNLEYDQIRRTSKSDIEEKQSVAFTKLVLYAESPQVRFVILYIYLRI